MVVQFYFKREDSNCVGIANHRDSRTLRGAAKSYLSSGLGHPMANSKLGLSQHVAWGSRTLEAGLRLDLVYQTQC